jgi:hypothetical protein
MDRALTTDRHDKAPPADPAGLGAARRIAHLAAVVFLAALLVFLIGAAVMTVRGDRPAPPLHQAPSPQAARLFGPT